MSGWAILLMVIILSGVWGGFVAALLAGMAREKRKDAARRSSAVETAFPGTRGGD